MTVIVLWVGLYAVHDFADYWIQTDCQATQKGSAGWVGRLACLRHVVGYVAVQALSAVALSTAVGTPLPLMALTVALAVSGVSHYALDRRTPLYRLVRLADRLHLGKSEFCSRGGAPALDQAAHKFMILVAAFAGHLVA